jgi:hypothetical protein
MDDLLRRVWQEVAERPSGPLAMRFYLQPAIAALLAARDGLKDARTGKPAYFWDLFTNRADRKEQIRSGWKSVGIVFVMAAVLDIVYQLIVLRAIRPVETVLVASVLALLPYLILRGPVNRVARVLRNKR